jgi:DNA mismatch repair protein MSH6
LADKAADFETNSVSGLLRSAEDLLPYWENIRSMFVQPPTPDSSELVPRDGVDKDYDVVAEEIAVIEAELEQGLQKHAKKLGYVSTLMIYG